MFRYTRRPQEPRVPGDHFALLVRTAIAEGVQLIQDAMDVESSDHSIYRIRLIAEYGVAHSYWLPVRTFKDPEVLAGALRVWRWIPECINLASREPHVSPEHIALLGKAAEGVQLQSNPINVVRGYHSIYEVHVTMEDNSCHTCQVPVRTFEEPTLLAGALRPWRWLPEEREAFERRHAQWLKELEKAQHHANDGEPSSVPSSSIQRDVKRLARQKR